MSASNTYLKGYEPNNKTKSEKAYEPDKSKEALEELKKALQQKTDEDIKYRRMLEDLLYNLDFDNMPAVKGYLGEMKKQTENSLAAIILEADEMGAMIQLITQWQGETNSSIASLTLQSNANESNIQLLTQWKSEAVDSIASIRMKSDANESSISSIVQWQGTTNTAIASVTQKANANEASISSIAQWQGETSTSISAIEQRVTADEAIIEQIVIWKGTATTSIASIEAKANANESSISSLTTWQTTTNVNISDITQKTTSNSASITLMTSSGLFTPNWDGVTSSVNASVVLATFTDYNYQTGKYQLKSNISLSADTIDLTGYVTFNSLSGSGQSTINGNNITTGAIKVERLESSGGAIVMTRDIMFTSASNGRLGNVTSVDFSNGVSMRMNGTAVYLQGSTALYVNNRPVLLG